MVGIEPAAFPSRRTVLKGMGAGATGGLALGTLGLGLRFASPAGAQTAAQINPVPPPTWDYPGVDALIPFAHGVASGDPMFDSVMLWTRITIPDGRGPSVPDPQGITEVSVTWRLGTDPSLQMVLASGTVKTTAERDWTVCIEAGGLPAAATLYYDFAALGAHSPVGRTRTAPAPDQDLPLLFATMACTSWWQDSFSGYLRVARRDDIDLIIHPGDHIYNNCGGHPAVRAYRDRFDEEDLDAKSWETVAEMRRRSALYYADPAFMAAHRSAPIMVLPDNHDVSDDTAITLEQAARVFWEWTPSRATALDGSGGFAPSTGPDVNRPIPDVSQGRYWYRVLPYGAAAQVAAIDIRYQEGSQGPNDQHTLLGNRQWQWLQQVLLAGKAAGVRHNVILSQVQMGQLRLAAAPGEDAIVAPLAAAIGADVADLQSGAEFYPGWGKHPADRTALFTFLRDNDIIDNVVVSGDSHGWFGWDMVEDNQLPNYEPATGGGLLGAVGVEIVPSSMGRPGGQDVVAEIIYDNGEGALLGSGNKFADGEVYRSQIRPQSMAPILALEAGAMGVNPNLRYFNWRDNSGHAYVQFDGAGATIELWKTDPTVLSTNGELLKRYRSPLGAPHLGDLGVIAPVQGRAQGAAVAALPNGGFDRVVTPEIPATPSGLPAAAVTGTQAVSSDGSLATTGAVAPRIVAPLVAGGLASYFLRHRISTVALKNGANDGPTSDGLTSDG